MADIKGFIFKDREFSAKHIVIIIMILAFIGFKIWESKQECPYSYTIKTTNREAKKICYDDLFKWFKDKSYVTALAKKDFNDAYDNDTGKTIYEKFFNMTES